MITAIILWLSPLIIMYIALNLYDYLTNGSVSKGIKARSEARKQEKAHRDETHHQLRQIGNGDANVVLQGSVRVDSVPTREHTAEALAEINSIMARAFEDPVNYTVITRQGVTIEDVNAVLHPTREREVEARISELEQLADSQLAIMNDPLFDLGDTQRSVERRERHRQITEAVNANLEAPARETRTTAAANRVTDEDVDRVINSIFGRPVATQANRPTNSQILARELGYTREAKPKEQSAEPVVRKYRRITL